jgi:hypothetical protein
VKVRTRANDIIVLGDREVAYIQVPEKLKCHRQHKPSRHTTSVRPSNIVITLKQTNSVAFSPRVNYTDWSTATCRRNLVPTLVGRGMSRGQRGGSLTVVNLSFLDRSRYFSFKSLLIYFHKGWVEPAPDSENLVAPGIEPGSSGLVSRYSDY